MANLVHHLNDEWARLSPTARPDEWLSECPALADAATVDQVLVEIRRAPDAILGFLLGRVRNGDALAARTVLQTMLGKLVRMSFGGVAAGVPNALDDLVTHMYLQIANYPLQARPRGIAANLALDTLKAAQRDWRRANEVAMSAADLSEVLDERQTVILPGAEAPTAERLINAAHDLGLITSTTREILTAVYGREGLPGAVAARRFSCSPAAIRSRCLYAIQAMAPHRQALAEAA